MDFVGTQSFTVEEIDSLAVEIKRVKDIRDELKKKYLEADAELNGLKEKLIEALGEVGKSSWHVEGVGKFGLTDKVYPRLLKDHDSIQAAMDWLKSKGEDFYLSHVTINSQTLGRILREERDKNPEAQIPGVDANYVKTSVSVRKG